MQLTGLAEQTVGSRAYRPDDPADICQDSKGPSWRLDEMEGCEPVLQKGPSNSAHSLERYQHNNWRAPSRCIAHLNEVAIRVRECWQSSDPSTLLALPFLASIKTAGKKRQASALSAERSKANAVLHLLPTFTVVSTLRFLKRTCMASSLCE